MALTTPASPDTTGRPPPVGTLRALARRLAARDPGGTAAKRSLRAAVVVPAVLAIASTVSSDPQVSLFATFGSFAIMLMAEFSGPRAVRTRAYLGLFAVGLVFIVLGTLCSTHPVPAVAVMVVIGVVVVFVGLMSPAAVTGGTAALLSFVLADAVAEPASAIPGRLAGWCLAGCLAVPACVLVWPPPWHDNLRRRLAEAAAALGELARCLSRRATGAPPTGAGVPVADETALGQARAAVRSRATALRRQFDSTPYPPGGTCGGDLSLARLVARLQWVGAAPAGPLDPATPPEERAALGAIYDAAAGVFEAMSALVGSSGGDEARSLWLRATLDSLRAARADALQLSLRRLVETPPAPGPAGPHPPGDDWLAAVDSTLDARVAAAATELAAEEALLATPPAASGAGGHLGLGLMRWRHRWANLRGVVRAHVNFRSVWFRNSLRAGFGLAVAVAVVEMTRVDHGFWVVLGALSVLRSNALGTGATALRALAGTVAGVVIGSLILIGLGDHTTLLWALFPLAVLMAGLAPATGSFAAGQAGFTVTVLILFNILVPTGWRVGLVRVQDVAIGCAVALVIGAVFWPRGATAALGRALCAGYASSADYLVAAVARMSGRGSDAGTEDAHRRTVRDFRRLDDCFRQYLSERGAKRVPLPVITDLVNGASEVALGATTMATLPRLPAPAGEPVPEVAAAGRALRDAAADAAQWYQGLATELGGGGPAAPAVPDPEPALDEALRAGLDAARAQVPPTRVRTMLRMVWADEHLRFQRGRQHALALQSAGFARSRSRWWA